MKTYYIPTSSLNFNNIFSSESISPKGFYEKRDFGYSRWTSIPENPLSGAILLYGEPKSFVRPQSDMEDHPMLIELITDEEFPLLSEGVYYSQHTIYLDPWHTYVYFFKDADRTTTLSMSDGSLETKMLWLYRNHIMVKSFETAYNILDNMQDFDILDEEIAKDVRINKLKGLLYGYYIGANLSITQESVIKLHALYEINDIISAILSNPERKANYTQQQELSNYLKILNRYEPIYRDLISFENNDINRVEELLQLIKKYGIYIPIRKTEDYLYALVSESIEQSPTLAKVQKQISDIRQQRHSLLKTDDSELVISKSQVQTLKYPNEEAFTLYKIWIEKVLTSRKYNGKINPERMDLATELTLIAKDEVYKEVWENSTARTYLNQLRRHLQGEEFSQQWNNGLLSSLAAVLIKGDDWEQLLQFMQYKEMFDYRLAFSLYGILNGFANLTRDFTDILLEQQDSQYLTDVYTEFYGQLFDKKLDIKTTLKPNASVVLTVKNQELSRPEFYDIVLDAWKKYNKQDKNKKNTLQKVLNGCAPSTTRQEFIILLKKEKGFTKGDAIEYIKRELLQMPDNLERQNTLFEGYLPINKFIDDNNAAIKIIEILPNGFIDKEKLKIDIEWFQNEYKLGKNSRYYAKASRNIDKTIDNYIGHLKNCSESNKRNLKINISPDLISLIYTKLKEWYAN